MSKAIMIANKPIWCGKIMNRDKLIEVRKNKALYKATKELIEEQGYATFFMYCSKGNKKDWHLIEVVDTDTGKQEYEYDYYIGSKGYLDYCLEGKVVAKFTVRKVEEITYDYKYYNKNIWGQSVLLEKSCLKLNELDNYLKASSFYRETNIGEVVGYAYHIEDLVIFDKPKELSEFKPICHSCEALKHHYCTVLKSECSRRIRTAPQNFMYVESEE